MTDANYCRECGAELAEDASFCARCGHEVGTPPDGEAADGDSGPDGDSDADGDVPENPQSVREHLQQFPGISSENTTRRNVLVGGGYLFGGFMILGAIGAAAEDVETDNGGGTGGNGNGGGPILGGDDGQDTTHTVGETFTVGGGGKRIRYTVTSAQTQGAVGGQYVGAEADGEFVILRLEMTSLADETLRISSNLFTLEAGGNEYETDSDAILAIEDTVLFEQLDPDVTKRGALVYDVPPSAGDRALVIDPAGTLSAADSHRVQL